MDAIAQSEAVQLFVARAKLHQIDFALTPSRSPVVAQICIRLDGIALALELAAARVRSLTVEKIHSRLHDRFALLTGGARTALPRQQTLRAALDWSFDLLSEEERTVFRHLAIFHGSFTLDAAMIVAATDTVGPFAATDLISQLVVHSLLVVDTMSSGARYRLLETPCAYAREKLDAAGETASLARRHAQYFRDYFECAPGDWLRISDVAWRAAYAHECDNVRAALDWAFGAEGDTALGIGLAGASGSLWLELSQHGEGRRHIDIAIARIGPDTPAIDQARLRLLLGMLQTFSAPTEAAEALEHAIDLYRDLGDPVGLGSSLVAKGLILTLMARFDEAASMFVEALPLLERGGVPKALARYFAFSGHLKKVTGDPAGARLHYEKALPLFHSAGAECDALRTLGHIADITWLQGDLDAAAAGFREAAALLRRAFSTTTSAANTLGCVLGNLSGVLAERGEIDAALEAAREAIPLLTDGRYTWIFMDHFALRAGLAGKLTSATRLCGVADAAHVAKKKVREPNELRARASLHALLRDKLAPAEIERLLAEGEKMSEEEAGRLALEA